jgi:hypothetical protein
MDLNLICIIISCYSLASVIGVFLGRALHPKIPKRNVDEGNDLLTVTSTEPENSIRLKQIDERLERAIQNLARARADAAAAVEQANRTQLEAEEKKRIVREFKQISGVSRN